MSSNRHVHLTSAGLAWHAHPLSRSAFIAHPLDAWVAHPVDDKHRATLRLSGGQRAFPVTAPLPKDVRNSGQ